MDKIYVNSIAKISNSKPREINFSTRRIFSDVERRYLSMEAQLLASSLFNCLSVSSDITENAIQQAVTLGSVSDTEIDEETFEALFHAVVLNPSFKLQFALPMTPFNSWVC